MGAVSAGAGTINTVGSTVTIDQNSSNLVINWAKFGTAAGESVVFNQPNASAIALNRVTGTESSTLLGSLSANGQVWLLNPNGVQIGSGATIAVGGWLASTLGISDDDFLAGKRVWTGNGTGNSVTNQGSITTTDGGYVALLGGTVSNTGAIPARLGTVALAAGNQITLDFAGDKLLNVQVDQGVAGALVQNKHLIAADGGRVLMTAKGMDALLTTVVNNEGVIRAQTVGTEKGSIVLLGGMDGGVTRVAGTLDASAPNGGDGGFIETSGATVQIADGAQITTKASFGKTGLWLIDPNEYTIAASGGDITGAQLSAKLIDNNVEIQSASGNSEGNGDIHVNDAVSWNAATTLTLLAERHINVNASITASNLGAGLTLTPGTATGGVYTLNQGAQINLVADAKLSIAGKDYKVITTLGALQGMKDGLDGNYALGSDVDAAATATATATWGDGKGFVPVGTNAASFKGILDGLGHQVTSLTINRTDTDYVGLIGYNAGTVRNIGVVGGMIQGKIYTGGLVGYNNDSGTISNAYATGAVGGAVGNTGGLVGENSGSISNAYTTGTVTGFRFNTGGLVGVNSGSITNAYTTGKVTGGSSTGGLVGANYGSISNAYATGEVTGGNSTGGLVGTNYYRDISNAYASGMVNQVFVTDATMTGGNLGTLEEVKALSVDAMKQQGSFKYAAATGAGFDFATTWRIYEGHTTPLLRAFLKPITVTSGDVSKTYDGQAFAGPIAPKYSIDGAQLNGNLLYGSNSQPAVNAGVYGLSGLWSTTYDISYASGTLTINPAKLTLKATNASKTYGQVASFNGATDFTVSDGLVDTDKIDKVSLSSDGSVATAGVKLGGYAITASEAMGENFNAANYDITYANGTLTVNRAALTVTANSEIKTYDGLAYSGGNGITTTGYVNGESGFLIGTLNYTGTAQGAKNVSTNPYVIKAGGLSSTSSNYQLAFIDGTLTINPKPLTATFSATPTKVYDGKPNADLAGVSFSLNGLIEIGLVKESITITQIGDMGKYADTNVGTDIGISADLSPDAFTKGTGTELFNYTLPTHATGFGSITRATLFYVAGKESVFVNAPFPASFGGTVEGFVNGESLPIPNNVAWNTMATAKSIPGSYAINGSGFDPGKNYSIEQDVGNAKALTIVPIPGCTKKKC